MPDQTLAFYDANAARYAADGRVNPKLAAFLARCKPAGAILELGTGSGRDARAMIDAGFTVDATDGSAELAAIAAQRLGQPVRVMRFEDLAAEQAYDGIYASASLLHVPRDALTDVLAKVYNAVRPGGVVWASFKAGNTAGLDALGRYYSYPTEQELLAYWQKSANWSDLTVERWHGSGFDDQPTDWIGITAHR